MLILELSARPKDSDVLEARGLLNRELEHPFKTLLIIRPLQGLDLSVFAEKAESRTIQSPNREVVWIKSEGILRDSQDAQWFDGHPDACAVVLERKTDDPIAWLKSTATRNKIDDAFLQGEA